MPTCDVDAVVQRGQGEAPLVEVREVGERRPPLWWRREAGVSVQNHCWASTPQHLSTQWVQRSPSPATGQGGLSHCSSGGYPRGCGPRWPWVLRVHCQAHLAPGGPSEPGTQTGHRMTPGERRGRPGSRGCSPTTLQVTPLTPNGPFWSGPTSVSGVMG